MSSASELEPFFSPSPQLGAGARKMAAAPGRGNAAPGSGDVAGRGGGAQPTAEGQQVEGAEGANGMRGYERCHGLRS